MRRRSTELTALREIKLTLLGARQIETNNRVIEEDGYAEPDPRVPRRPR